MASVCITPAREAAFSALIACEKQGAWSDQAIQVAAKKNNLSSRDAALASTICYGILQNRILLDYWIDCYSKTPCTKLDREVRLALRMGLYQLHFLDRIPDNAAVNESVNLVRKYARNKSASGLVNAVLRAFQRAGGSLPKPSCSYEEQLSIFYSHPLDLIRLLSEQLNKGEIEALLSADNTPVDTFVQVNTLKVTTIELAQVLARSGADASVHPWMPDCLSVRHIGDIEKLPEFQAGSFYVQDCAAKLAAMISGAEPGCNVLDACAAPGGKSFAAGILMKNRGCIISCDLQEKKLVRINRGAARLGLDIIASQCADGRIFHPEWERRFDVVLADVPCSGLGIIRKKPDIRYKDLEAIKSLPGIQYDILQNVERYVKPGGVLVYSTCTVLKRENEAVIDDFLLAHNEFECEDFILPEGTMSKNGMLTLWPHIHGTDGFFMAKLRRKHD